jgi:gamma-glutamylcyclotransferase (GGCT)/AIG2-like uncharacterized protein YtfP
MVFIFQYGSHVDVDALNSPDQLGGRARHIGPARLPNHSLTFDLYSKSLQSAVADVVPKARSEVLGALYEIPDHLLFGQRGKQSHMDVIEEDNLRGTGNYQKRCVEVIDSDGKTVEAWAYIGTNKGRKRFNERREEGQAISSRYVRRMLSGYARTGFPKTYITKIKKIAQGHNKKCGAPLEI